MNAGTENLDVTDVVTSLTFIDLPLFDYDEFQDELTSIHARLQYLSTGEQGSRCLFFPGLLWWYTITQKPEDRASSNGIWHLLNGPGAYKTMLDTFMNAQGIADVALELTNNLEYTTSNANLPTSMFPSTMIEDSYVAQCGEVDAYFSGEVEAREVSIYPAYLRLVRAPQVTLPPSSFPPACNKRLLDHSPFNTEQLITFNHDFPPGLCLAPITSNGLPAQTHVGQLTIYSDSSLSSTQSSSTLSQPSPTVLDTRSHLYSSRTPSPPTSHLQDFLCQMNAQPTPPSDDHYIIPQHKSIPTAMSLPYSLSNSSNTPSHKDHRSIPVYTRPKPLLGRRYSIPFDQKSTMHGTPICPSQVRHVSASDSSSQSPTNLGFENTNYVKYCFGNADWIDPDFGIFGGLSNGTVI